MFRLHSYQRWAWGDSNSQPLRDTLLRRTRIPIPPHARGVHCSQFPPLRKHRCSSHRRMAVMLATGKTVAEARKKRWSPPRKSALFRDNSTCLSRPVGQIKQYGLFHRLDGGAESFQAFVEIFIAAVYRINIKGRRLPCCGEHANEEHGRRAERRRRFDFPAMQGRRTFDKHSMRVKQFSMRTQFVDFQIPVSAAVVHPVVNERVALCLRRDGNEKWKIVRIDSRERARCDFLRWRNKR